MKQDVSIAQENQNLREIIEVAKQITSDLEVKRITKSIHYYIRSKFGSFSTSFILPFDIDDDRPLEYLYQNNLITEQVLAFNSIDPLINYFIDQECNQITFTQFSDVFFDEEIKKSIKERQTEFIVPLKSDKGITGIFLQGAKKNGESYTNDEIQFIVTLLGFVSISLENANLYRKATVDRMTKLFNHHQFQKTLSEYIEDKDSIGFSLLMFDIDHFKTFNDSFGHLQGDSIIREIAHIVLSSVREVDYPARYGGEEFAIILPGIELQAAYEISERLRKTIADFKFSGDNRTHNVTISLGVAMYEPNTIFCNEDLISITDKALYNSKKTGRNKTSVHGSY